MKYCLLCLGFAVIVFGCDSSEPDHAQARAAAAEQNSTQFPFGLTTISFGGSGLGFARRKVCYTEVTTSATQCVLNRAPLSADGNPPLSWDAFGVVQNYGYASSASLDVGELLGFDDVLNFEAGVAYELAICGAGNAFQFTFLQRAFPGVGGVRGPGVQLVYLDDGLPGTPDQFGDGQFELVSSSGAVEILPIALSTPIASGPACDL